MILYLGFMNFVIKIWGEFFCAIILTFIEEIQPKTNGTKKPCFQLSSKNFLHPSTLTIEVLSQANAQG